MYYLRQQTQISGPFTVEQLKSFLHRGRVARSDKISTDKQTWIPISQCVDIAQRPNVAPETVAAADTTILDGIDWFYTVNGAEQPSAISTESLAALIAAGTLDANEMVWRQGYDDWMPLHSVAEFASSLATNPSVVPSMPRLPLAVDLPPAPTSSPAGPSGGGADYHEFVAKKVPAGVAALLVGPLGIHKFILGLTTGGVSMLLLCLLLIPIPFLALVAFVEGLLYLTKTDDAFYRDYAVAKKQWF